MASVGAAASLLKQRHASRRLLGLSVGQFNVLKRLDSPRRVQAFLDDLPANHEPDGETLFSVSMVLAGRRAHCMEAAMLAACALWIQGEPPLLMRLGCDPSDYPHIVALFRAGTRWGAISKSNSVNLMYRDAVYSSRRELAMSYFHEYANERGQKTLRSYSTSFDMRRLPVALWVTATDNCWTAHDRLEKIRHFPLLSAKEAHRLVPRNEFERNVSRIEQYPRASS